MTSDSPITSIFPDDFGSEEIGDGKLAAFALARKGKAQKFLAAWLPVLAVSLPGLVHDDVIALALRGKISVNDFRLEHSAGNHFFFQLLLDGTEFLFHQAQVILLRRGLQLPLVLEQRGFVDERKQFPQVEILAHPHAPERRDGNIRRIFHHRASLREHRSGFFIDRGGLGVLLDRAPFLQAGLLLAVRRGQVFHDVQAGKGVVGIEHGIRVFPPQIVFHVLARQRGAAADHRELQLLPLQVLDHVLHLQRGLHQQAAQADGVGLVFHART